MIAGRADTDSAGAPQGVRQHFLDWLESGQDLLAQVSSLCGDLEERRAQLDTASREAAAVRDEMASLRQENETLRSDKARLADELVRLRSRAESLEAEAATIRSQNAALMDERGETAKLIADKLEDMLAQVLPRLSRHGAAAADPGSSSRAAVLAALTASVSAPPAPSTPAPVPPAAPAPAAPVTAAPAPVPSAAPPAAAPPPNRTVATLVHVAPSEELEAVMAAFEEGEPAGAVPVPTLLDEPPVETATEQARVLIVDDEADFTELLRDHLGSSGYAVLTASSGDEALRALADFQPRVVLLDMMMAGVGGMETLRRIKAVRPETLVVMITALDDRDVARRALAAGAADYLTKPLSLDFLDSALAMHAAGPLPATTPPPSDLVSAAAAPTAPRRAFFGRA